MVDWQWEALDPERFEDLCATLISRMHPDVRRVEGAGPDAGFDVLVPTAAGPMLYEIKSPTKRLTPATRRALEKSLDRAASFEPSSWNFVIPLDPTQSDARWFKSITSSRSFDCNWLGRTWLEAQLSRYPDVRNYYLEGLASDLPPLLRELLNQQGAAARGIDVPRERLTELTRRLNVIDPQYSFGLTRDSAGSLAVSIWPKYVGAERDRPLEGLHSLALPEIVASGATYEGSRGPLGRIEQPYAKHSPPSLDLRALLHWALSPDESIQLEQATERPEQLLAAVRILNENGRTVAQLPMAVKSRTRGGSSAVAVLEDSAGAVVLSVELDQGTGQGKLTLSHKQRADALPTSLIPGLQFISRCRPPNSILLLINGTSIGAPIAITEPFAEDVDGFLRTVEAVAEIQRASGVYFELPQELSDEEIRDILSAQQLLKGEEVRGTWSGMRIASTVGAMPSLRAALERGPGTLAVDAELTVRIGGQTIPLGMTRRVMPTFVVAEWPESEEGLDPDTPVEVVLEPGPDRSATTVLINDGSGQKGRVRYKPLA